jgi:hypothetical protein
LYGTIRFPDVNGDGKADVCGRGYAGIYCALSTGTTFAPATLWTPFFRDADSWHTHPSLYGTIRFPDVNGDGKADVCGRGYAGIYCALSTGTTFASAQLWTIWASGAHFSDQEGWHTDPSYWSTIQFPDIDGDGKADVCGRSSAGINCARSFGTWFGPVFLSLEHFSNSQNWHTDPSYWSTIQFPDVNGDGRADVCGRGAAGMWCALKQAGNTTQFHPPTLWDYTYDQSWPSSDYTYTPFSNQDGYTDPSLYRTIQFADLNNDGRDDVCARDNDYYYGLDCYIASFDSYAGPSGGFQRVLFLGTPIFGGWNAERYYRTIRLVHVNGDGLVDACGRGDAGVWCQRVGIGALIIEGETLEPFTEDGILFNYIPPDELLIADFGDNQGWGTVAAYWSTVQFADVDGDGRDEVCGRGAAGILCGPD